MDHAPLLAGDPLHRLSTQALQSAAESTDQQVAPVLAPASGYGASQNALRPSLSLLSAGARMKLHGELAGVKGR